MTSINHQVWDYIEQNIEIKKNLLVGLINTSALARTIASDLNLTDNIDAVISGIRRFEGKVESKNTKKVKEILKKGRISTKSKLSSLLIVRNEETEKKSALLHNKLNLTRNSTLRTFEATEHISVLVDEVSFNIVKNLFSSKEIIGFEKDVGELSLMFEEDATKIPGLFSRILQELAVNDIQIIDSLISHWEIILILKQETLTKASNLLLKL